MLSCVTGGLSSSSCVESLLPRGMRCEGAGFRFQEEVMDKKRFQMLAPGSRSIEEGGTEPGARGEGCGVAKAERG
ncbi:hypothetical protein KTH_00140 [Thermosporothrix hazakensis]|nr:hypothetical protein KTH_00140 [Thermosporothrix hazakensis]